MNYLYKYPITTILFSLLMFTANAQHELGVHFMEDIWQSGQTNPAFMNDQKVVIALPSVYARFYHSGFTFEDAFRENGDELSFNLDNAITALEDKNDLNVNLNIDVLGVALRFDDIQVGLSWSVKGNAYTQYTRETLDLFWNGNADYVGRTANINPEFQFTAYNEIGLSGAYNWQDKFTFGTKIKYLTGISDTSTDGDNTLSLTTSDDVYQISYDSDFSFRRAGFSQAADFAELTENDFSLYNLNDLTGGNNGFGIDLGVTANLIDRLTLSVAVTDLGRISWKNETYEYNSKGIYTYEGLDLFDYVSSDTLDSDRLADDFEQVLDTIAEILDIRSTASDGYTTSLNTKAYLSGSYEVLDDLTIGALIYIENANKSTQPGFALSARKKFGKWFTLGASYAFRSQRFDNLGLNAVAHLGPVQIYAVSDNIAPLFKPLDSKNYNFRVGLNLAFGRISDTKSQTSELTR